ncbi:MAG TPA: cupredoxin domain-containing protein [Solirubrobacterales bacterium]|nr:cupredoxin domain-containing protein [Solirubrobacterales bacterium]
MKRLLLGLALVLASLTLVACGGSSNGGSSGEASKGAEAEGGTAGTPSSVEFEPDPSGGLEFTTDSATAKAGKVTVDFTNLSGVPHNVAIEDSGGKTLGETEIIPKGSESTVVNLKPGTYTFYCAVPGHREAGMEGTLTVK